MAEIYEKHNYLNKDIKVDVRVLAATNKNLKEMIAENKFREDLYHRLSVIIIKVPPLKERKEDIPLLADRFLEDVANDYGTAKKRISSQALIKLQEHNWSGNIRELRNVIERLVIMGGEEISEDDVLKYTEISH